MRMSLRAATRIGLLGVLAATAAEAKPRARPPVITVSAGDYDRQHTPVPVTLPPELAGKRFELRGPGGRLPLDVDGQGNGLFVLPALKKGKQARYQLHESKAKAATGVEVTREGDNVEVRVGGKRLLRYQAQPAPPKPDIPQDFHRGGYLHPVFTPSGIQVSDDYPADHKHHHGIFTAWTSTEYEGRKPDFWNMGGKKGRKDHLSTGETLPGGAAGRFTTLLSSTDLGVTPPKQVLKETWRVTAYRTHPKAPPYFLFDLEWTDEVLGNSPLVLPQYRYGGLGVRGHIDWLGKDRTTFLTSDGKDRTNAENTPARWVHMAGKVRGEARNDAGETLAGIAALDHPANFRAPQPVRISPDQPYFIYSPMKAGKMQLEPGKPYVSRYRFVVADGAPDRALLDRLWNDWAHPPAAELKQ